MKLKNFSANTIGITIQKLEINIMKKLIIIGALVFVCLFTYATAIIARYAQIPDEGYYRQRIDNVDFTEKELISKNLSNDDNKKYVHSYHIREIITKKGILNLDTKIDTTEIWDLKVPRK
jgi:hypothetical protein